MAVQFESETIQLSERESLSEIFELFCVEFSYTISGFLVRSQWMLNFDVYNVRMRMRMR